MNNEQINYETILKRYINESVLKNIKKRIEIKDFTELQKKVLDCDEFWDINNSNNFIIQGATSSGKTLVAEWMGMQYVAPNQNHIKKKVVYLLPLKALIREKQRQFQKDVEGLGLSVFASSSDYQDHDKELNDGNYDIAIMVYEKFFSMIGNKSCKLLKDCGLVIADELQNLESKDRGPKLEFALLKTMHYYPKIRILGILTSDYDTILVQQWLQNAVVIKNDNRPVKLLERIINLDGIYWERKVEPNTNNSSNTDNDHIIGKLDLKKYDIPNIKGEKPFRGTDELKNQLLANVINNKLNESADSKIIVFANSKRSCSKIAEKLCKSGALKELSLEKLKNYKDYSATIERFSNYDETQGNNLKNMLKYQVAYHTAALPAHIRESIEREFCDNKGAINIIITTETLMTGMNLPADMVVLYHTETNRGKAGKQPLKPQEYKNYIGRAGRLGLADSGVSYFFLDNGKSFDENWNIYVKAKQSKIKSAFAESDSNIVLNNCAPYFLNLLSVPQEEIKGVDINFPKPFLDKTLFKMECQLDTNELAPKVLEELINNKLIKMSRDNTASLSNFGEALAPYALCLESTKILHDNFFASESASKLPLEYSADDLRQKKYFVDILYQICTTKEVQDHPIRNEKYMQDQRSSDASYADYVISKTLELLDNYFKNNKNKNNSLWPNSNIDIIVKDLRELDDSYSMQDILDAERLLTVVVMLQWLEGKSLKEIKNNINKENCPLISTYHIDYEQLGTAVGYLLEAISNCICSNIPRHRALNEDESGKQKLEELKNGFYVMSQQAKYGIEENNLLQISKWHIYGLSRDEIIEIGKNAQEKEMDVACYIRSAEPSLNKILNSKQKESLLVLLKFQYSQDNFEYLLDEYEKSNGNYVEYLKQITIKKNNDNWEQNAYDLIDKFFSSTCEEYLFGNSFFIKQRKVNNIIFVMCKKSPKEEGFSEIKKFLNNDKNFHCIILTDETQNVQTMKCEENIHIIDGEHFCRALIVSSDMNENDQRNFLLEYFCQSNGFFSFKSQNELKKHKEEYISLREQYLNKIKYTWRSDIDSGAYGKVFAAQNEKGDELAIKELDTPLDEDEKNFFVDKAKELESKQEDLNILKEASIKILPSFEQIKDDIIYWEESFKHFKKRIHHATDAPKYLNFILAISGYFKFKKALILHDLSVKNKHIVPIRNQPQIIFSKPGTTLNNNHDNAVFIAMEKMDGSCDTFKAQMKTRELAELGIQICDALSELHTNNFIHRDIKPKNILYKKLDNGQIHYYLTDFGTIREQKTDMSTRVGTSGYIAPEVSEGKYKISSDIYSLGITMSELYSRNRDNNDPLEIILKKASHKDPSERYQNANELKDELQTFLKK